MVDGERYSVRVSADIDVFGNLALKNIVSVPRMEEDDVYPCAPKEGQPVTNPITPTRKKPTHERYLDDTFGDTLVLPRADDEDLDERNEKNTSVKKPGKYQDDEEG